MNQLCKLGKRRLVKLVYPLQAHPVLLCQIFQCDPIGPAQQDVPLPFR